GELVALGVVELLHRADQTEVALLDQVQEQHAAAGVALGQRDHQTEVGLKQVVLGAAAVLGDDLQLALQLGRQLVGVGQLVLGEQARLDALGEFDLLLGVEQRDLADLLEVVLDRVGGGTGGGDLLGGRVVLVLVGQHEAGALGALGLLRRGLGLFEDLFLARLRGVLLGRRLLGGGLLGRGLLRGRLLRGGLLGRGLLGGDLLLAGLVRGGCRRGGGGGGGLPSGRRLRRARLGGGALGGALRCAALAGALGLCGTDHQRHTLFLEDLVEAAQYVLPLSGRNLVSFEGPTHVIAGDLPLSLSPLNERHDRDGLGDLRRERTGCAGRHEQPLGTLENGFRPRPRRTGADRRLGDWADGAGGGRESTAPSSASVFPP